MTRLTPGKWTELEQSAFGVAVKVPEILIATIIKVQPDGKMIIVSNIYFLETDTVP